jgi:hypothetical protein
MQLVVDLAEDEIYTRIPDMHRAGVIMVTL